ncbi:hypothetical protein [Caulobacter segnis]
MRDGFEKAISRANDGSSIAELESELASGRALLWVGERSALVTTVHGQDMHIWLGCGDLTELKSLDAGICAHARARGCSALTINGRSGWARALRALGFVPDGDELRKLL